MELADAANYFKRETFSTYDSLTKEWDIEELEGRLLPVDKFLSNFSRPLHRRMLVCHQDQVIPPSSTIRSEATGEIYIVGQARFDAYANNKYQALYMVHLVTGLAGGLGLLTRRSAEGPSNDPGYLVTKSIGEYYMDIELRATSPEKGAEHLTVGQYFLLATPECKMTEWDYITLNGKEYRVEEEYYDSGLSFSRVTEIGDDRVDIQYIRNLSFNYDPSQGTPIETSKAYNITAAVHDYKKVSIDANQVSENTFKVIVQSDHIGFDPTPRESVIIDGTSHIIVESGRDPLKKEWVMICQA